VCVKCQYARETGVNACALSVSLHGKQDVGSEQKHLAWREQAQRGLIMPSTETGSDVLDESEEMTFEQDELGDG
jgi:hypothetical protein